MMRLAFGAVLGLLVAFPTLLTIVATAAVQPSVLAAAVGVLLWPRITRRIREWTR
ncbi:hypothetical protein QA811_17745 [Streptomyces sp. B21-102]|uniref:hypothetical protein n=1 Tax=Streptomyces sp. B21-102 TaxID=3039416 RepID=UPI002FF399CD